MLLSLSACSTSSKFVNRPADPFLNADRAVARTTVSAAELEDAAESKPNGIQVVSYEEPANHASSSTVRSAAAQADASATKPQRGLRVEQTATEPRVALHVSDTSAADAQVRLAGEYPDEYLFDGGDRALPVHYDSHGMLGLESEDTVVEYADDEGRERVKPTNRVAVYSPRFAAVSSIRSTSEEVAINKLAGAFQTVRDVAMNSQQRLVGHQQNVASSRVHTRSRGSEVDGQSQPNGVDQMVMVSGHAQALNVFEDLSFIRTGQFDRNQEARLSQAIQAAHLWSREQSPAIAGTTSESNEVYDSFNVAELVGLKDARKKGDLRIVKLADRQLAKAGDEITFTIRYDNVGERELRNIVITDNLSPRLEYVPDSATSDREGRLVEDTSNDGTLILRWEMNTALPGLTGGVVTFKATVK
ncbi:MAG: DUF11 domain-containing protein [Planctomycetales bacterium]|nr:DUF11 domain-containing protein [Planctomycetales bacterium]